MFPTRNIVLLPLQPFLVCKVGCQGVLQLGGLILGYLWEDPLWLRLVSLFYSLKFLLKGNMKNTCGDRVSVNYEKLPNLQKET